MYERRQFAYHPVIGFRYIPDIRARCRTERGGCLVRTNNRGFRCDHDFITDRNGGRRRILVFGDSFTAGNAVSNGERYTDLLEDLIPDLEVYNFGLPGSGTDQQYLAYREYACDLEHDLLVLGILVENIRRVCSSAFYYQRGEDALLPKPYYTLEGGELRLHHVPVPREPVCPEQLPASEQSTINRRFPRLRKWVGDLGLRDVAQRLSRYQPVPEYRSADGAAWQLMRAILMRWIEESPVPVLLFPMPLHQHVEGTSSSGDYMRRFRELARDTGCPLHDPLPDLLAYSRRERRGFRFERDVHPTPEGHRALARSLAPAVQAILGGMTGNGEEKAG